MAYEIELPDGMVVELEDNVPRDDNLTRLLKDTFPRSFEPQPVHTQLPPTQPAEPQGTGRAMYHGLATSLYTVPAKVRQLWFARKEAELEKEEGDLPFRADAQKNVPDLYGKHPFGAPLTAEQAAARKAEIAKQREELTRAQRENRQILDVAAQVVGEATPDEANIVQRALISGASSAAPTLAALGVGVVNPLAGLAAGSALGLAQTAGPEAEQARRMGASAEDAYTAGWVNGGIEFVMETIGNKQLLKESPQLAARLIKDILGQGTEEGVTSFFQDAASKTIYDPTLTPEQMGANAFESALAGVFMGAAASPFTSALDYSRRQQRAAENARLLEEARARAERADADEVDRELYKLAQLQLDEEGLRAELEKYGEGLQKEDVSQHLALAEELLRVGEELKAQNRALGTEKLRAYRAQVERLEPGRSVEIVGNSSLGTGLDKRAELWRQELIGRARGFPLANRQYHDTQAIPDMSPYPEISGELQALPTIHTPRAPAASFTETVAAMRPGEVLQVGKWGDTRQAIGLRKAVERWAQILKYNRPIILVDHRFSDSSPGAVGRAMLFKNAGVLVLNVDRITENPLPEPGLATVAVHEFGHLLFAEVWEKSSVKMKDGLVRAWAEQYNSLKDLPLSQALMQRRSPVAAARSGDATGKVKDVVNELRNPGLAEYPRYLMSFREWTAHQMERALDGDFAGMQSEVRQFLRQIFERLKGLYQQLKKDGVNLGPTPTYEKFLRHHILSMQVQEQQQRVNELTQRFNERYMKAPTTPALQTLGPEALSNLWLPGDQSELGAGIGLVESRGDNIFTRPDAAARIAEYIKQQPWFASIKTVIEPSAGAGDFLRQFPGAIGLDIAPRAEGIQQGDFLQWQPQVEGPTLVVGNPPFGSRGSLAKAFMAKSADFADYVVFVLPRGFNKKSVQRSVDKRLTLVESKPLSDNIFYTPDTGQKISVGAVLQIWKRQDRVDEPLATPKGFKLSTPNDYDVVVLRVGSRNTVGQIVEDPTSYSPQALYYLKATELSPSELRARLRSADWSEVRAATTRQGLATLNLDILARAVEGAESGLAAVESREEPPKSAAGNQVSNFIRKDLGIERPSNDFRLDLDRFSKFKQLAYGILEIAKVNRHIRELYDPLGVFDAAQNRIRHGYVDYVMQWHAYKMKIVQRADTVLKSWRTLKSAEQDTLNKMLTEEDLKGEFLDLKDPAVLQQYKATPAVIEQFIQIRKSFQDFLNELESIELADIRIRQANNPRLPALLQEAVLRYDKLRAKPYFPHMWFGRYLVRVVATKEFEVHDGKEYRQGETIRRFAFSSDYERQLELKGIAAEWGAGRLKLDVLSESLAGMAGMPREFLQSIRDRLDLTDEQRKELEQYLLELSPANGFSKRMMQRKGTLGYSLDLQRSFAAYFMSGSNHLARMKFRQDLKDASDRLAATTGSAMTGDVGLRREISNYVRRHFNFVMNPENDWSSIRGAIAISYLGFNLKSAFMNMTQLPLVTIPYLTKKFGNADAIREFFAAGKDLKRMYSQLKPLSSSEQAIVDKWGAFEQLTAEETAFIERWTGMKLDENEALNTWLEERNALMRAVQEGFLDESFAMELAAMSEGGMLQRFHATSQLGYKVRAFAHLSMAPFEMVERMNRRVTFLAAYRLAKGTGLDAKRSFIAAREAVQDTQLEYAKWNRPEMLRGKKGIFFMFWQYQLGMLRLVSGGDDSWKRILAMMLLAGGLYGLPFAENIADLITLIGTWLRPNERLDPRYELKKYLEDFIAAPDLLLHGTSRYGFGLVPFADLSGGMSFGRIIPGTDTLVHLQTSGDFNRAIAEGVTDAGGATAALAMRMLQAFASNDSDVWRRIEKGMPLTAGQSVMTALRWYNRQEETLRSGASIAQFDLEDPFQVAEIAGRAIGFTPRAVTAGRGGPGEIGYEEFRMRREFATYYATRREALMRAHTKGVVERNAEGRADAMESIRRFNDEVPFRSMKISGEDLARSAQAARQQEVVQEQGLAVPRSEAGVMREIGQRAY